MLRGSALSPLPFACSSPAGAQNQQNEKHVASIVWTRADAGAPPENRSGGDNVAHGEEAAGTFGEGAPTEQIQIAVMLRTDVFRAARARTINSSPGPVELFSIVNTETAKHLAQQPFPMPDLAAVLAECQNKFEQTV